MNPVIRIRERVVAARACQKERFTENPGLYTNAQMPIAMTRLCCPISKPGQKLLEVAMDRLGLSARAYQRIIKVARTSADLADSADILEVHLAEAIQYRSLDRESWGS